MTGGATVEPKYFEISSGGGQSFSGMMKWYRQGACVDRLNVPCALVVGSVIWADGRPFLTIQVFSQLPSVRSGRSRSSSQDFSFFRCAGFSVL